MKNILRNFDQPPSQQQQQPQIFKPNAPPYNPSFQANPIYQNGNMYPPPQQQYNPYQYQPNPPPQYVN